MTIHLAGIMQRRVHLTGVFETKVHLTGVVGVFVPYVPGVFSWDFSDPANSQYLWLLWDELMLWG